MDVDPPEGNKPATDPDAPKPATDPDAPKPATDPDAPKPATDPDAPKPATDPPGKAGQLTPAQIKDIIYKIVDHNDQGLPDILPQGFALTIGEVKAILKDPANRQDDDFERKAGIKRNFKCETALSRFEQYESMDLKDEDLWKPGLGADTTEWKEAASLNSEEKEMLLQIADVDITDASDITDVIPPNFKLTPSEILDILHPPSWPDDEAKAQQACTKLNAAVDNNIIELGQLLESSRAEEDGTSIPRAGKLALKEIFKCITSVTDQAALSEAIETNVPPGEDLAFSFLAKMADPNEWSQEYEKKLAQEAKIKIDTLVPPDQRQVDFLFQHREKRQKPPTLLEYHRRCHQGMTPLVKAIIDAIYVDGRNFPTNENVKAAAANILKLNNKIKKFNGKHNLVEDTGVFTYLKFAEMWLGLVEAEKSNEVEAVLRMQKNLELFCKQNSLPNWYSYDDKPKPKQPRPTPSDFDNQTTGSSVELWGSKAIAYVPSRNTEPWEYRPGYTPQGEKIEYRQRMGAGVYFVVHGPQGWRLTPSGSVGGKLARRSAEAADVEWVLSGQEASRYLDDRLCQPNCTYKYDVWFVAIQQLDLEKKIRVPNMIVGFKSTINDNPDTEQKVAFPRTALDQFLGKDTVEALVSRHITPHRQLPLRQALAIGYRNAGADSASLRPLTQRGKATQELKLIDGLRNLYIQSPQEFEKLTGSLGLVRADRRLEWKS
ncbi:uncharacterized protein BDV17DRAFT_298963 [Aspergillus undulatus]|uniref:uncharacterized protein n=1 Tax=Aspergillus undulatus TaxID=1810928 RepID=UPI003CCD2950